MGGDRGDKKDEKKIHAKQGVRGGGEKERPRDEEKRRKAGEPSLRLPSTGRLAAPCAALRRLPAIRMGCTAQCPAPPRPARPRGPHRDRAVAVSLRTVKYTVKPLHYISTIIGQFWTLVKMSFFSIKNETKVLIIILDTMQFYGHFPCWCLTVTSTRALASAAEADPMRRCGTAGNALRYPRHRLCVSAKVSKTAKAAELAGVRRGAGVVRALELGGHARRRRN